MVSVVCEYLQGVITVPAGRSCRGKQQRSSFVIATKQTKMLDTSPNTHPKPAPHKEQVKGKEGLSDFTDENLDLSDSDLLCCALCSEIFCVPVLLFCGHSICLKCAESLHNFSIAKGSSLKSVDSDTKVNYWSRMHEQSPLR